MDTSVQVALVTAGGTVTAALIGVLVEFLRRQKNAIEEVRENTQEAREQVSNTHTTNLRDDLDRVIEGLEALLAGQERHDEALTRHGQDITVLRDELRHERVERLAVAERLDDHVAASN